MAELVFIGVPYYLGEREKHTGSVDDIQASGIASEFDAEWVVIDPQYDQYSHSVNAVNAVVATAVKSAVDEGKIPLIIAGDCTTCVGNMKGLEQSNPAVLWYDAHGDFNTEETSPSGFLGGMPLAAMVGMGNQHMLTEIGMQTLDDSTVYLTDGRDLDPPESELVANSNLTHWQTLDGELAHNWDNQPLYIHFDGDIIRLADHPAVGYPATGGPSTEDCIASLSHAIQSADVKAVHFTCWNNDQDGVEKSKATIMHVIRKVAQELRQ